ncbi:hypothetical protein H0H81_012544 [Sphagnurus paluster]|uniref:Uncharacterized protein n=1 Tax=Sphagnurus paluster TaxID=117069 RepID=A0A9P7GNV3_9AGAR|nr:hypothetical protein H0H81_012544 [Sphagnurus paluster]
MSPFQVMSLGAEPNQLPDTPPAIQVEGLNIIFGPAGDVTTIPTGPSQTVVPAPHATIHHKAPHHTQVYTRSNVGSSWASQPQQTFLQVSSVPGVSAFSTATVISVTSPVASNILSISSAETALDASSSIAFLSSTTAPDTTPLSTDLSTTPSSSIPLPTTEATTPEATPTSETVSISSTAVVETSSSSSSSAAATPSAIVADKSTSSDDGTHHAGFYIAIIIGTIVIVGIIAAFVAWFVRLRLHSRRRRADPLVPWANNNEDGLEEGHETTFIGQPIDRIGSKDISSQDVIPWEPRGDRDVGEPKRSPSYVRGSVRSSVISAVSGSDVFQPEPYPYPQHLHQQTYPILRDSVAYPLPLYQAYARGASSQMVSEGSFDGQHSASTLGPLQVANGTPGDVSVASSCAPSPLVAQGEPRKSQVGSQLIRDAWARRASYASRRQGGEGDWEQIPMPGEAQAQNTGGATTDDSWTASLKSNLTHAFNAVAANLPSAPTLVMGYGGKQEHDGDNLTPRPQQGAGRSMRSSSNFSGIDFNAPLSRNDTVSSAPWTLEEHDDGTGRVHFRGQVYGDGAGSRYGVPQILGSCATLAPTSAATSIYRISTHDSRAPLMPPPKNALLGPDTCKHHTAGSQYGRSSGQRRPSMRSGVSRAGSVYSLASGASSAFGPAPCLPAFSRHSTMRLALDPVREKKSEDLESECSSMGQERERPAGLVSRSSSSGCSFGSYYYGTGADASGDEAEDTQQAQALTDRRRRLRRVA